MASKLVLSFLFTSSLLVYLAPSSYAANDINWWCNQTPYPEPCKHFMGHLAPKHKTEFHQMAVQTALERALVAQSQVMSVQPQSQTDLGVAALADCQTLYENTILQLNRTLSKFDCTEFDQQTWLSTALTNIETCKAGFVELGTSESMPPLVSNNVSYLISNSLALQVSIDNNVSTRTQTYENGFPSWVSRHDRKLLQSKSVGASVNLVVAQDGSGNYRTITEAINAATKRSGSGRFVIHVKSGVYKENVVIGNKVNNVMLVGDGMGKTVITSSKSVGGGTTTFNSATFAVTGDGFIAKDISFRNTAGPQNHQAVAVRAGSDLSVFYQCSIEGYQDTLYVHSQRQFFKQCNIYGTVDFIFGNAAVVFQNCNIYARKPMSSQKNTVTAQGRTDPNQNTGIVIHNSNILAAPDLKPLISSFPTYLGRPWKAYSRTVVMQTFLDQLINSAGWLEWDGNFALNTLYYGEYKNSGLGSSTSGRVKWRGYRVITNVNEASKFSVANFIGGQSWLSATGVPFTAGL